MNSLDFKLKGVTFENRQDNLGVIYNAIQDNHIPKLLLKHIPNEYDPNAITVLAQYNNSYYDLGFVPKEIAATLDNTYYIDQYSIIHYDFDGKQGFSCRVILNKVK